MVQWKAGRGLLGPLQPLLGTWRAEGATAPDGGALVVTRDFSSFGKDWLRLDTRWEMGARGAYQEIALFGKGEDGALSFWSFTNDGKRSQGTSCDGADVDQNAVAFVAEMPAGTARFIYWPDPDTDGFRFAVENKVKKGWNRFLEHRYVRR